MVPALPPANDPLARKSKLLYQLSRQGTLVEPEPSISRDTEQVHNDPVPVGTHPRIRLLTNTTKTELPEKKKKSNQDTMSSAASNNLSPSETGFLAPPVSATRRDSTAGENVYDPMIMANLRKPTDRSTPSAPELPSSSANVNNLFATPTKNTTDLFATDSAPSVIATNNNTTSTPTTVGSSGFGSSPASSTGNPFKDGRVRLVNRSTEKLDLDATMADKEMTPSPAEQLQTPKKQSANNEKRRLNRQKKNKRARGDSEDPEASMTDMAPKATMVPAPATFDAPASAPTKAKGKGKEKAKTPEPEPKPEKPKEFVTKFDPFIKSNSIRIYIGKAPEGWVEVKPEMGAIAEAGWQAFKAGKIKEGEEKIKTQVGRGSRNALYYWEWTTMDEFGQKIRPGRWIFNQEMVTISRVPN
ncbi:uncharacterized protein PAC_02251 [Phialocephala subalpina]|uniref:Uncharacterized protein n=1 Tax=Phialocephala subalpina TaxID=576137 RepID=A0A1L7WHX4_9HELO|nr:uncharacterized protein PAC_02251 [Phialocephala subalpina]